MTPGNNAGDGSVDAVNSQDDEIVRPVQGDSTGEVPDRAPSWPGGARKWVTVAIALVIIAIAGQIVLTIKSDIINGRAVQRDELLLLSAGAVTQAGRAVTGRAQAYGELAGTGVALEQAITALDDPGNSFAGRVSGLIPADLVNVFAAWKAVDPELKDFLETRESVTSLYQAVVSVNDLSVLMLARSDDLVEAVARESGNVDRVNESSRLRGLGQTVAKEVNQVLLGGESGAVAASRLSKELRFFSVSLDEIRGSAQAVTLARLESLQEVFNEYESAVEAVAEFAPDLFSARSNLNALEASSEGLVSALAAMNINGIANPRIEKFSHWLPMLALLAALVCMLLAARSVHTWHEEHVAMVLESRHDAESTSQQESILKLLDEISALADGDLTISAEVTDQVTGSIADSINFAVEEMRGLVRQINSASVEVANGAQLAVQNARFLSDSNMQQARDISQAAEKMEGVAASIRQMSDQARNLADVAGESASVAKEGTEAVMGTIKGLDDMREQIQETSKRIKRLGESSQQIGEIVQLIDDIAEQTNILSLNAAIQASMAGDAGRGFAVVADEVQRLAERSTNATGRIGNLVQAIQSDTSDAILSMELATQEVVAGTRIADTAGQALGRIESASDQLTGLIAKLAEQADREAGVVTGVSRQVGIVRDQSTTTAESARSAADTINKLTDLATELEQSVARFRLPDELPNDR
jgi:twitching motility protein PilJ